MATFKDNKNREWEIALDAPTINEVRQDFEGLDLADQTGKVWLELDNDLCLLVDVLWRLCRDQAKAIKVDAKEFGASLVGDAIGDASAALTKAMSDFFPPRKRKLLQTLVAKQQRALEVGLAAIDGPEGDKILENLIEGKLRQALTQSSSVIDTRLSAASTREG